MKKIFLTFLLSCCLLTIAYTQVKITKATAQKTFGGIGGIFMNYTVGFKNKTSDSLVIDSVKTTADTVSLNFYFNKTQKSYYELAFSQALVLNERCRTCPDIVLKPVNFTKGVIIYYTRGNKKAILRAKKFQQLEDLRLP